MKNKRILLKNSAVVLALHVAVSCARPGIPDEEPSAQPQPPRTADSVNTVNERLTRVGFELYPDVQWRYPVCDEMSVTAVSGLEAPQLDGDLSDWSARPYRIRDREGDDTIGRDITSVGIDLVAGGDLYLGIASAHPSRDELHFELGVISAVAEGSYVERSLRYLRWSNGVLEWWQDGAWQALPGSDLAQAVGDDAVEMRLNRLFIGELMAYPAWFVKVSSRSGQVLHDMVSTAYLPGTMMGVEQRLAFQACRLGDARVTLLRDRAVSNEVGEDFFRLARLGVSRFEADWGAANLELIDTSFFVGGTDFTITREPLDAMSLSQNNFLPAFALPRQWLDAENPSQRTAILRKIILASTERNFAAAAPQLSGALRAAVARGWALPLLETEIGKHHALASYWEDVTPFLGGDGAWESKSRAWGHVIGATLKAPVLQQAWLGCQSCGDDEAYRTALVRALEEVDQPLVAKVWMGWHDDQPHDPDFTIEFLRDHDGDGLPLFMENRLGVAPDLVDTDKDGWSDYAEWLFGTDGRNALIHPSFLSVDGLLGDWRDLMPTRIKADPDGATDECAGAGAIEHFVALADRDAVIVAAQVRDPFRDGVPVSFEVVFDFPQERRKFSLQAESGARHWRVQEEGGVAKVYAAPFVVGTQGFEMVFRASDFGLTRDLRDDQAVNMRMRTSLMRTSQHHCDDTPWFRPLIRDNRP